MRSGAFCIYDRTQFDDEQLLWAEACSSTSEVQRQSCTAEMT